MHLHLEFLGGQSPAGGGSRDSDGEEDSTLITARDIGLLEQKPRRGAAETVASSQAEAAPGIMPNGVVGSASSGWTTGACMSSDGSHGGGEPLDDWPSPPGVAQPAFESDDQVRDCIGQADGSRELGAVLAVSFSERSASSTCAREAPARQ